MPQPTYPTAHDLYLLLVGAGAQIPDGFNFPSKINAAVAKWERAVEYRPFLSTGVEETRYFNPPGPSPTRSGAWGAIRGGSKTLSLGTGLVSLTSLTVTNMAFAQNVQFWLRPSDAPAMGRPYEWIEFYIPPIGYPQSIAVTGVWGFGLEVPDDVWEAVLQEAAKLSVPALPKGAGAGVTMLRDENQQVQFAAGAAAPWQNELAQWTGFSDELVDAYRFEDF